MSFDYIIEKDNSSKTLSKEQESVLVKKIVSDFKTLNAERSTNLEMASSLANEIFFKNDFKSLTDKTKKWKAKVKMCKTFMFYQTLKSFIWKQTYANVNSMFDVSGENHDSNNMSNKQKAMLVKTFEEIWNAQIKVTYDHVLLKTSLLYMLLYKMNLELQLFY